MRVLMGKLEEPVGFWTIFWVYGPRGNEGKSLFAKYLNLTKYWFYSSSGKIENVMYLYMSNPRRHVVFDIPRNKENYINYDMIETIKDRILIALSMSRFL